MISNTNNNDIYHYIENRFGYSIDIRKELVDTAQKGIKNNVDIMAMLAVFYAREGVDTLIEVDDRVNKITTSSGNYGYDDIGKSLANVNLVKRVVKIKVTDFVTGKKDTYNIEGDPQVAN